MTFKELSIGDTFDIDDVKYIKTEFVLSEFTKNKQGKLFKVRNAVCIDEYSDEKGKLKFFSDSILVSHVNWS